MLYVKDGKLAQDSNGSHQGPDIQKTSGRQMGSQDEIKQCWRNLEGKEKKIFCDRLFFQRS